MVIDFGALVHKKLDKSITVFSPFYSSLETLMSKFVNDLDIPITPEFDVFSIGVILFLVEFSEKEDLYTKFRMNLMSLFGIKTLNLTPQQNAFVRYRIGCEIKYYNGIEDDLKRF